MRDTSLVWYSLESKFRACETLAACCVGNQPGGFPRSIRLAVIASWIIASAGSRRSPSPQPHRHEAVNALLVHRLGSYVAPHDGVALL